MSEFKLLSVIVPSYNAATYLSFCVHSLAIGGQDIEILIVNDGSNDQTADVAQKFVEKFPQIVRLINQENKGHGGAINTGLAEAKGIYVKVVDSDDWVDTRAFLKLLETLRDLHQNGRDVDAFISNFVYEKELTSYKRVMHYRQILPENQIFGWEDVKPFPKGKYMMMHALIYRTALLREIELSLPEHTFYVDNLFVFKPLQAVKKLYYLDVDFYRYLIGRDEQSVNEKVMIKRIDQQLLVNRLLIDSYNEEGDYDANLNLYLKSHLEITTVISSALLNRSGTEENLKKKEELWSYLKESKPALFREFRRGFLGNLTKYSGYTGRKLSNAAYSITKKIYGFN